MPEKNAKAGPAAVVDVETDTNRLLRKKYFVDKDAIVSNVESARGEKVTLSRVIKSSDVRLSPTPRAVRCEQPQLAGQIHVDVVREQGRITGIRIACPCGRHAELNCEYTAPLPGADPGRTP